MIDRVPDLSDIHYMLTILGRLGCEVEGQAESSRSVPNLTEAPYEISERCGPQVVYWVPYRDAKRAAKVSLPGGCVIGDRPIDLHLKGFEALGAKVHSSGRRYSTGG